ncbi:choice-of-anchor X domain-containing protein [Psychrosphaera algicola]|uniref:Fibronectin type-III domain-containing protein n=1 Tax=Psychrosphaera algicola TaxID=3023714 RepID=A0ABT5FCR2_9GAMM|nr:choice-of-anchor X domain-containing protein [Psychrosphaera sp. G1-22]MDC2888722.1 hypothetical protein [Psychrosphaera sp. G1-22]
MQNASGSVYYDGFGTPIDQIGDGVAETLFELNGATYIVDGINNPRSTPNFPNVDRPQPYEEINNIWSPKNVGAWWDLNNPDQFPDVDPRANMGTLAGQVILDGFDNNSGVLVEVVGTSLNTMTDVQGNWSISLTARDYTKGIKFNKPHFETQTKTRTYTVNGQEATEVTSVTLIQQTAKVSGQVSIDDAADFTQTIITADRQGQQTIINPNASGTFVFDALPLGEYQFSITYPNGSWETVNIPLTLVSGQTEYTLPVTRVRNSFVNIDDGALYTNSTAVTLSLTNAEAVTMVISENGSALPSESFVSERSYTLTDGDGDKVIEVAFYDGSGVELTPATSTILLDTQVNLSSLTMSDVSGLGDTLLITLQANEVNGQATVTIPSLFNNLELNDDGIDGDVVAGDGIYSGSYIIETAQEINATAIAMFVDKASNEATITSDTNLNIATSPTITNLLTQSVNGQLVISFETNELTNSTINFGTTEGDLDQTLTINADGQFVHIVTLDVVDSETIFFEIITSDGVTTNTSINSRAQLNNNALTGTNSDGGNGEIGIVWGEQASAANYNVYRSEDSNQFTLVATTTSGTPYYVDNTVANDIQYYYRVTWLNDSGEESDQSESTSAKASIENTGPTELTGGVIASNTVWLKSMSPYIIAGNMLVKEDKTLFLMPGVEVQFNGENRHIYVDGKIMAYGSESEMVTISSDTAHYTNKTNQSALIYPTDANQNSVLSYTQLNYVKVFKDYESEYSRRDYVAPLSLIDSEINFYAGYRPDFYIKSAVDSVINVSGYTTYSELYCEY